MSIKVKIGTVVKTDFGTGQVVAITKEWLIHNNESGREVCIYLKDNRVSVPCDTSTPDIDATSEIELS